MENVGKEMDGFGKRLQMPKISVSCSLQACILNSLGFILAATSLGIICKPLYPAQSVLVHLSITAQSLWSSSQNPHQHFWNKHCIGVVKSTFCRMWTVSLRASFW